MKRLGTRHETAPIVALLSDKKLENASSAARAFAAIGDQRTVVAMDAWLNSSVALDSGNIQRDEVLRKYVIKYRDELKQKLEKAKKPGN